VKYIICSGWWCAKNEEDTRSVLIGADDIRGRDFHKVWYKCINKFTNPEKILIVDSCSSIKPELDLNDGRLEFVSLNVNAGHSTNHSGKLCGVSRAFMLSLEYALQCDIDYYVYVEQDGLIYGKGIIEECIKCMKNPYMFGSGEGTPQRTQQSLFIIKQEAILKFLNRYREIPYTDNQISPEEKFHIAACLGPVKIFSYIFIKSQSSVIFKNIYWYISKYLKRYDELPIGYGRKRPINFADKFFYFQHGEKTELDAFFKILKSQN